MNSVCRWRAATGHGAQDGVEAERFAAWVDAGRAGEMEYLKRRDQAGVLLRSRVQVAIPWARSVMVCAMNYNSAGPLSVAAAPAGTGWIARYAWSGKADGDDAVRVPTDYHDELLGRLRRIEAELRSRVECCETRCYVCDTGPLVERTIAAQAGVGWIGKNTCVLNEGLGSWLLLGVIVTSLPVAEGRPVRIAADRCGSCTRCIDACPTDALVAPREMDAARCIAYLTIEKKGAIAAGLRERRWGGRCLGAISARMFVRGTDGAPVAGEGGDAGTEGVGESGSGVAGGNGCGGVSAMV